MNIELWRAIAKADPDCVRRLIAEGADIDAAGDRNAPAPLLNRTPLWASVSLAASVNSEISVSFFETFKEEGLVRDEDDPRKQRRRYLRIIRLLIKTGVDMEKRCHGSTPLRVACIHNDLEVAEILLTSGADPNAEIYSPLSKRAKKAGGHVVPGYYGTILHEIVAKGFHGATAILIKAGADPNRVDHKGMTAFDIAAKNGGGFISKLLEGSKRASRLAAGRHGLRTRGKSQTHAKKGA